MVAGGKLWDELKENKALLSWWKEAISAGKARRINDDEVNSKIEELNDTVEATSDDVHVLALAYVSGARLLYTNDVKLIKDFKQIPNGKVYTTIRKQTFRMANEETHGRPPIDLLERKDLCAAGD